MQCDAEGNNNIMILLLHFVLLRTYIILRNSILVIGQDVDPSSGLVNRTAAITVKGAENIGRRFQTGKTLIAPFF